MATPTGETCEDEQNSKAMDEFGLLSPPPYDVSEKIREANRLLQEDDILYENAKSPKVKFKEQIVEFEIVLSDFSSDEAASTDDWLMPQLKESDASNVDDKNVLDTDSDDGDTCLLPLEDEVKLDFPRQVTYHDSEEEEDTRSSLEHDDDPAVQPIEEETTQPIVILVSRDFEYFERSEDEILTEKYADSSPVSDDIPTSCDGFSISTDIVSSKMGTESSITDLDMSEEFHVSLDLNREGQQQRCSKVMDKSFLLHSSPDHRNKNTEQFNSKRKEALKRQNYRKSIEGPLSSQWDPFQTVMADTPRDSSNEPCTDHKERPSSGRGCKASANAGVRARPWTAPNAHKFRRKLCGSRWNSSQLPNYNGLRSEYGLSKEQLEERKKLQQQLVEERQERTRQKKEQENQRRDENERVFRAWLFRKQAESAMEMRHMEGRDDHKLNGRLRREQADACFKQWLQRKREERLNKQHSMVEQQLHSQDHFSYRPDEAQQVFKKWLKSKQKPRKNGNKLIFNNDPATLKKILNNVDAHTQSTFRIYLGISTLEMKLKKT